MKKVLTSLILVSLLAILAVPLVASAQETIPSEIKQCTMRHDLTGADWTARGFTCVASGSICTFSDTTKTCGVCCIMDTVYTVTDWIFVFVITLVIIFILLGAFNLLTAAGTPEKIKSGRDYIIFACIGMLVALLAKSIPWIVRNVLGV